MEQPSKVPGMNAASSLRAGQTLTERGRTTLSLLDRIEELAKESAEQRAVVRLWANVMLQGHDPDDVDVVGYNPKLDTRPEKLGWKGWVWGRRKGGGVKVYNFVRHKDGFEYKLDPPIPVPAHMLERKEE